MKKEKLLEVISFIGSIASVIGLFFIDAEWTITKILLLVLLVILVFISGYILFVKKRTKICKTEDEINAFMKDWIKTKGVVKILSRDLSWVDDNIIDSLTKKKSDLYLYVEKENDITEKIKSLSPDCNIIFYGDIGFVPNSRYTIIHANKPQKQLAIAIKEKRDENKIEHEIYITSECPIDRKLIEIADDLLQCIDCKVKNNG